MPISTNQEFSGEEITPKKSVVPVFRGPEVSIEDFDLSAIIDPIADSEAREAARKAAREELVTLGLSLDAIETIMGPISIKGLPLADL